ncbi:amidase signature enzyme [Lentinula raphanica]|nr:amidase signature enzyme [Lentinula raphanica]
MTRFLLLRFSFLFFLAELEAPLPDLYEASILELQHGLDAGQFTSVDLIKAYFARIEEVNIQGPGLRAVIEMNPSALAQAAALDVERAVSGKRSMLHGIPILLKVSSTIITWYTRMNTTAGSFALLGSVVPEDAGVVKRLRKAGAIILGKANLSEFAEFRGNLPSGWSGRGGQTSNAYFPHADPCGSSSGSGVATSIGLTTIALGTETDGSITCPTGNNNLAGVKPSVGLTSRAGVIPISEHQDTVGPMCRSLTDAAIVLSLIAGPDPNDNFTSAQPLPVPDYTLALNPNALSKARIGVPRKVFLDSGSGFGANETLGAIGEAFEEALGVLRELGAEVVDPADLPDAEEIAQSGNETVVLDTDFKIQINAWLEGLVSIPSGVRSLADLIAFDNANPALEEPVNFTSQSEFIASEATTGFTDAYFQSLAFDHELGRTRGIDAVLEMFNLDALVLPAMGLTTVPAVPLGFFPPNTPVVPGSAGPETVYPAPGVPFGLSFLGTAFSEFELIGFGFGYEQRTKTRLGRRAFPAAIPKTQLGDVVGK